MRQYYSKSTVGRFFETRCTCVIMIDVCVTKWSSDCCWQPVIRYVNNGYYKYIPCI